MSAGRRLSSAASSSSSDESTSSTRACGAPRFALAISLAGCSRRFFLQPAARRPQKIGPPARGSGGGYAAEGARSGRQSPPYATKKTGAGVGNRAAGRARGLHARGAFPNFAVEKKRRQRETQRDFRGLCPQEYGLAGKLVARARPPTILPAECAKGMHACRDREGRVLGDREGRGEHRAGNFINTGRAWGAQNHPRAPRDPPARRGGLRPTRGVHSPGQRELFGLGWPAQARRRRVPPENSRWRKFVFRWGGGRGNFFLAGDFFFSAGGKFWGLGTRPE